MTTDPLEPAFASFRAASVDDDRACFPPIGFVGTVTSSLEET